MKDKYNHFIENHCFLTCLISIIIVIKDIIFVIENQANIILALSLISIISAATAFIRLLAWKTKNYIWAMDDTVWRVLELKKQEDRYLEVCLKHAKYSFLIACIVSIVEIIPFIITLP